jgi:uncharacterized protein (TIGR00255 family)
VELRTEVANDLVRGKVELNIGREAVHEDKRTEFDEEMIAEYFKELNAIKEKTDPNGPTDMLSFVLRMPEVTKTSKQKLNETEWAEVHVLFRKAVEELNVFRTKEGAQLEKDIRLRLDNICDLLTKVEILDQGRTDAIKERLKGKIEKLKGVEVDENRLEQELVYYIEKLDINEEKVRLKSHCSFFIENVEKDKPQGKKLGFISQEIGREINTIGSKANDADIQKAIVQMKDELEKIKEQLLNVL